MQKIVPFLWFDHQAEEAMNYYLSIFKNAKVLSVTRYPQGGPGPEGSVMAASFEIEGQEFNVLNGGPQFHFTEAVSFYVKCETQAEIDYFWQKLTAGGVEQQCGWLKDKYGVSWQIVPPVLITMLGDADRARAGRVMQAMLQMKKINLAILKQAYQG